eukprot:6960984-Pyramimonas_sp.AAC.1
MSWASSSRSAAPKSPEEMVASARFSRSAAQSSEGVVALARPSRSAKTPGQSARPRPTRTSTRTAPTSASASRNESCLWRAPPGANWHSWSAQE